MLDKQTILDQGSSPRIRGELGIKIPMDLVGGIIPANTGRISAELHHRRQSPDHPREYGENLMVVIGLGPFEGSSPRIRGECVAEHPRVAGQGIIPANTGRMDWLLADTQACTDHPREYGENKPSASSLVAWLGSSPRIRGEYSCTRTLGMRDRIIPANTGRICLRRSKSAIGTDHPREYGENFGVWFGFVFEAGSSPRIRGEFNPG